MQASAALHHGFIPDITNTDVDNPCSPDIEPKCYPCPRQNSLKTLELTSEELKLGIQGGQLRGLEEERRNHLEPHWLPAEHSQMEDSQSALPGLSPTA